MKPCHYVYLATQMTKGIVNNNHFIAVCPTWCNSSIHQVVKTTTLFLQCGHMCIAEWQQTTPHVNAYSSSASRQQILLMCVFTCPHAGQCYNKSIVPPSRYCMRSIILAKLRNSLTTGHIILHNIELTITHYWYVLANFISSHASSR